MSNGFSDFSCGGERRKVLVMQTMETGTRSKSELIYYSIGIIFYEFMSNISRLSSR